MLCGVFVHDGQQVATGDSVSGIRLWDAATGATVRRLEGQGKSVISAGWSPDGQAVAWGHSTKDATVNFGGRLERTFCFNQLDFGPPPDKTFVRARPQMGQLQMGLGLDGGKLNMRKVGVQRGGTIVSMFTLPQAYDQVRCFSLLSAGRAAIGSSGGAYVIDINTALVQLQLMDRGEDIWGLAPSPTSAICSRPATIRSSKSGSLIPATRWFRCSSPETNGSPGRRKATTRPRWPAKA